jgi:FkbM family methyltransferase
MKKNLPYFINGISDKYTFTYIDVGAMGGLPQKWEPLLDSMQVIAFEPDPREFNKLKSSNKVKYLNYALHEKSEDLKYYITEGAGKSSVYRPNMDVVSHYEDSNRFRIIHEEIIPSERVRSLDAVIEENAICDADFIKLDTQGSELPILKGGSKKLLPMIFGSQIEVEFVEMYKRQPLFRNIDDFMYSNGYSLIDLRRAYWKRKDYYNYRGKGQLIFGDALYFKRVETLSQELSGMDNREHGISKIMKCILVCLIYKMFDYAVAVAHAGRDLGYLDSREHENTVREIKRSSRKGGLLNTRLYASIYSKVNSYSIKFRPMSYLGWADGDHEIGNIKDS